MRSWSQRAAARAAYPFSASQETIRVLDGVGFRLRKWYLDCVAPDGTLFIGYAGRAGIGPVRIPYQARLAQEPGQTLAADFTTLPAALPSLTPDGVRWRNGRLAIEGTWNRRASAFERVLHDADGLRIEWRCHLPTADVSLEVGGRRIEGLGYGEELTVRGSLSRLRLRELRWGRFVSERSYVVWVEWVGGHPLRLVLADGREGSELVIDDDRVSFEVEGSGKVELALGDRRVVRDERVADSVFGPSWRRRLVPVGIGRAREVKWVAPGRLASGDGDVSDGWVVYERVTWPR